MKAAKIKLFIRIKHGEGKHVYAAPAWNRNHTLRTAYVVDGKHEHLPEGIYCLRYGKGGKRVWKSIGTNADRALVALATRSTTSSRLPLAADLPSSYPVTASLHRMFHRRSRWSRTRRSCLTPSRNILVS